MNFGLSIRDADSFFEQPVSAHRELHEAVQKIRRLLHSELKADEATMKAIEATHAVLILRDQLRRRFEQEEAGGYFDGAIAHRPRIASHAAMLRCQHRELLDSAERMLPKPDEVDSGSTALVKLKTDFETFVRYLQAHEAAENRLLEQVNHEVPRLSPRAR